ncbi:glycosyltransferase [Microbacterium halophytorum]|uniref:glycosyltransferase n=1 Tax=Microbacterium halophytorum TaxID=2067568 RepID=UPI000CFB4BA8|nr:glycosyltransferase [Microbacterium halophytorum]
MPVSLRVVLDQVVHPTNDDLRGVARDLTRALIATAPVGCRVEGIAPVEDGIDVDGLFNVTAAKHMRRDWPLGFVRGSARGIVHSPTLLAPLMAHDRVNDGDQTVVSVWDLSPWVSVAERNAQGASRQRGLLRRAARYADAIVVPTHAMADELSSYANVDDRLRVIPGAVELDFAAPIDSGARRIGAGLPERFAATSGGTADADGLLAALSAIAATDLAAAVLDVPTGQEDGVAELAQAAGLSPDRVVTLGPLARADRAAVISEAAAFVAGGTRTAWPWRAVEAMSLAVPLVAVDSPVHREVIYDGGLFVAAEDLGEALRTALGSGRERLSVLGHDRSRAFTWAGAAEKVWHLHADL